MSTGAPLAFAALERMGRLFDIERALTGQPAEVRRAVRQKDAVPLLSDLQALCQGRHAQAAGQEQAAATSRWGR